jgi:lipoprotein-releasing system permease protein
MIGVSIITAAFVIVLSVFNGLEGLLHSLNNSFDPEIKIEARKGKSFEVTQELMRKVEGVEGVEVVTEVIEDYVYARYRTESNNQVITIKGVSENFLAQNRIPKENIVEGEFELNKQGVNYAIVGSGVKATLGIFIGDNMFPLQLYYIKNVKPTLDPSKMYSRMNILAGGVFSIVQQFDDNYVIVPLKVAEQLMDFKNRRTSLEIKIKEGSDIFVVEKQLEKILGDDFKVLNHEEQHVDIYRLLKMEKLFTFLSGTLLLGVGSINIFFSLMMLALDKKKDISILSAIGASQKTIRNIFLFEGGLIALSGALSGLLLGAGFCYLQQNFALISMGMENAVLEGYPVTMYSSDFISTLIAVSLITLLVSVRPAVLASRFASVQHL